MDAEAIAARAVPQDIKCPAPDSSSEFAAALRVPCEGVEPATPGDVYEVHNGKGPFYYPSLTAYAEASPATSPASYPRRSRRSVVEPSIPAPCPRTATGQSSLCTTTRPAPFHFALSFVRSPETSEWGIEKLWFPFPSVIPSPMPERIEVAINSVDGRAGRRAGAVPRRVGFAVAAFWNQLVCPSNPGRHGTGKPRCGSFAAGTERCRAVILQPEFAPTRADSDRSQVNTR